MNNDWTDFRKDCRNRKDTHGSHDLCVTIDQKGVVQCYHGECDSPENCPAPWRKALAMRESMKAKINGGINES